MLCLNETKNTMTYSQLTIHQKINAKANAIVFYPSSKLMLKKLMKRDPDTYYPIRLVLKSEQL